MKTVEDKAIEAYEENQKQKKKYQIEDEAWMDWFTMGYEQAEKDCQPKWIPIEDREHQMPNKINMSQITEKELINLLEDGKLCDYCPYTKNSDCHSIGGLCEGSFCEDAKDNYVEDNELELVD